MNDAVEAGSDPGRYRVLLQLGEGGTASVYLALASGLAGFNKLVVLKRLRPNAATDPEMRRSFITEARVSARLSHPNIVQVNEIIEEDGLPVIVMEYLEGQPMDAVIRRAGDRLPLGLHLHVLSRCLRALEYAHSFRDFDGRAIEVVHRDVSPHNVFVTYEGSVKLLDFGIAKLNTGPDTVTGVIKGKVRYMAPEQILGEPVDRRTDLYAVGVMLWEAIYGRPLWKGLGEATIMNRVINGELPAMEPPADVPPELFRLLECALSVEPEDRPASAKEMRAAIDAVLDQLPPDAKESALGELVATELAESRSRTQERVRLLLSDASLATTTSQHDVLVSFPERVEQLHDGQSESRRRVRATAESRPARWPWLALAGVLAAVGVVAFLVWPRSQTPRDPPAAVVEQDESAAEHSATAERAELPPDETGSEVEEDSADTVADDAADTVPATVTLSVTAFPAGARLFLDDEALEGNPHRGTYPADDREHTVRAEAAGRESAERTVRLDENRTIVLRLERRRRRPSSRSSSPASSRDDCDPPYYLDNRGIKRFRPQCL